MKTPLLLTFVAALLLAPAHAKDDTSSAAPKVEMQQWEQDFLNLAKETREEFQQHMRKARELFQQKRVFETVDELKAARKIFADSPDVENMLGACQVEFRAFDKAMKHFERANELSPGNPSVLFNIAEVRFVSKDWEGSERDLERILVMLGDDPSKMPMARLMEFKLLLTKIKLGKEDEVTALAGKYDIIDDSPYMYYAEAALAFKNEDELVAEAAIARATRVFRDANALAPWQDTLMEFGYIKSLFATEIEATQ